MAKNSQNSYHSEATHLAETIKVIVEQYFGPVVEAPIKRMEYDLALLIDRVEALEFKRSREQELLDALQGLYDMLPRYSCKADKPDGCPVCVARTLLKGASGLRTNGS